MVNKTKDKEFDELTLMRSLYTKICQVPVDARMRVLKWVLEKVDADQVVAKRNAYKQACEQLNKKAALMGVPAISEEQYVPDMAIGAANDGGLS